MWTVISTINSEATSKLIKDSGKNRRPEDKIDQDQLIEIDPSLFKEIEVVVDQKNDIWKL